MTTPYSLVDLTVSIVYWAFIVLLIRKILIGI